MKIKIVNSYKAFCTALILLFLSSCELEEMPRDTMTAASYSSPIEVQQGVIGAYSQLRNWSTYLYLQLYECRGDNTWVEVNPNALRNWSEVSTFRADYTLDASNRVYGYIYSVIDAANTVIDNMESVYFPGDNDEVSLKKQLRGEAHFLRGWCYFELVRIFGNIPIIDGLHTPAEIKQIGQSTPKEVYENIIIPDLLIAETNLPYPDKMIDNLYSTITAQGRADLIAAKAMLGRVYMTMSGFPINDIKAQDNAEVKIKEVLDYAESTGKYWPSDATEWQRQWLSEYNNRYSIFAIQYRSGGYGNPSLYFWATALPPSYTSWSTFFTGSTTDIWVEKTLQYEYTRIFSNGERDARGFGHTVLNRFAAEGSFLEYSNMVEMLNINNQGSFETYTRSFFYKYWNTKRKRESLGYTANIESEMNSNDDWPVNLPIIRLEDMMLMYAEIQLNKYSNYSLAVETVNKIRQRANCDPITANNVEEAMKYLKRERRLEFAGEGVRWNDIVRWGEWKEVVKDMWWRYAVDGQLISGLAESNLQNGRHLFPIPQSEMNAVPGLYTQNEGYD